MPLKALREDYGRDCGGPKALVSQRKDKGEGRARTLCESADSAGIEDQHALANLAGRALRDSLRERFRTGLLVRPRFTNLCNQGRRKPVRLRKQVAPSHLCSNGALQELRGWQPPLLHETVKIVGQVYLHARHTPKYTPSACPVNAPFSLSVQRTSVHLRRPGRSEGFVSFNTALACL